MLKKTKLWAGLSAVMVAILIVAIFATATAMHFADDLNSYFNIKVSEVVRSEETNIDTEYFKSEFGEFSSDNLEKLDKAMFELAREEMREGVVLLKNDDNALPLKTDERKVTLFGNATHNPLYRTYGAGSKLCDDPEWTTDLKEALEKESFEINPTLWNAYTSDSDATGKRPQDKRGKGGNANNTEHPIKFYSKYTSSFASYNDVAIVSIARQGGEGVDMNTYEDDDLGSPNLAAGKKISSLALHQNEKDMLSAVKNGGFDKIIVLINSPFAMELDWFDEYDIDAALWISTPGSVGFESVAEILVGKVNPSGLLTDIWVADSLSAPAMANSNGNTPKWTNSDTLRDSGIITIGGGTSIWDSYFNLEYVNVQQENIYVGYKYYETRYADIIMNKGNANSKAGVFKSRGNWNYAEEVCYTLGFGMSYTDFSMSITDVTYDESKDNYAVEVKVKNTGATSGKRAVVVYAQTPYGNYEKTNGVEKSAIQPVGFSKTDLLKPDGEQTLTIPVDRYMLASYDDENAKGYILSGGDYYFAVGNGAHEALNNILSVCGYTGLTDHDGKAYEGDSSAVKKVTDGLPSNNEKPDMRAYSHSKATGARVTNVFDIADYNYFKDDTGIEVKYLTRSDWDGTFPVKAAQVALKGERMEHMMNGDTYTKDPDAVKADTFTFEAKNDITFVMMKDVPYENTDMWNKFIDQFSLRDLCSLFRISGTNETVAKPNIANGDGCDGAGNLPRTVGYGDKETDNTYYPGRSCVCFTSLMAATYNKDIQKRRGELMGELWLYSKTYTACTGGGNVRRTPFSGRNAEYYTEDSNLNTLIGAIELGAMNSKGVCGGPKHFATNDMEFQRMSISVFSTEQGLRENSLRSFEYQLRRDKADLLYVMTCNYRIGTIWTQCCKELQTDLLRTEWGFRGMTNSDSSFNYSEGFTSNFLDALMSGHDSNYSQASDLPIDAIEKYVKESNDGDTVLRIRERAKNMYYCWTRGGGVNGLTADSKVVSITPVWQKLVYTGVAVLSVLTAAVIVMFVLSKYKFGKN